MHIERLLTVIFSSSAYVGSSFYWKMNSKIRMKKIQPVFSLIVV